MVAAIFGGLLFLLAAIWEAHVVPFLPLWAGWMPLWPCVVIALCLEVPPARVAATLGIALAWRQLALPVGTTPLFWAWFPLLFLSYWLLRVWLSHRSLWSALVLVVLGRLAWVGLRLVDLSRFPSDLPAWRVELPGWGVLFAWDAACVMIGLPLALALGRRLAPYLPRFGTRDHG